MTRLIYILMVTFTLITLTSFQNATKKTGYDWTKIKEFKFYGYNDPSLTKDAKYILADTDKIKKIFLNLKKSDGFLPKGGNRFAKIIFDNKKEISIQIIGGGPFRVIKKDIFSDKWFDFENNTRIEWSAYIKDLTNEIENKNSH